MKLGIIGAMDVEVATLKEKMENASVVVKAGMEFYEGTLEGLPAVVVKCGIGKVNAAMCAQILCGNFEVTHLVNTGIAGSLLQINWSPLATLPTLVWPGFTASAAAKAR